ncbi:MAG: tetratricopeptide repeat protein [Hydrococcus sp. SU_1_0]|nr:tetratricopeptide repeat protein [Hydrococcus sp. SU_1_0]
MFDWLVDVARRANLLERTEYSEYLDFLIEVFKAIAQSDASSEVVYSLFKANQDKLNDNLILVLRELITAAFEQEETEQKQNLAEIVFKFSSLIHQFPLSIRTNNVEIAISCYQVILQYYLREVYPYEWARIHNNLANAYCTRIKGDRAENLETAINYYQESLKVRTFETYPDDWAMTQGNLAVAYRMRIRGKQAENLEIAISLTKKYLKYILWKHILMNGQGYKIILLMLTVLESKGSKPKT